MPKTNIVRTRTKTTITEQKLRDIVKESAFITGKNAIRPRKVPGRKFFRPILTKERQYAQLERKAFFRTQKYLEMQLLGKQKLTTDQRRQLWEAHKKAMQKGDRKDYVDFKKMLAQLIGEREAGLYMKEYYAQMKLATQTLIEELGKHA